MELLKKGTPVKTASTTGEITGYRISEDGEDLQYRVAYLDHGRGDEAHERYFLPHELTVVKEE